MTKEEFKLAKEIIWDDIVGSTIQEDLELSKQLGECLKSAGVKVVRVGKKPRSRHATNVFILEVFQISGLELQFISLEEAQSWHSAKTRGLNTLTKAPDEAFEPVKTDIVEAVLYWNRALTLAYRLNCITPTVKDSILIKRGVVAGNKFGI